MAIQERREVEIKFRIGADRSAFPAYRKLLLKNGFALHEQRLETDFLPDTVDGLCKKNGMLLRFRQVQNQENSSWLLTLKIRDRTEGFQDSREIETLFNNLDDGTFNHINDTLRQYTGHELNHCILTYTTLDEVAQSARTAGFTAIRILLEKYREEYSRGNTNITLDYFPDGMGAFLEIEDYTAAAVEQIYRLLKLPEDSIISTDYGDLLKLHKQTLPADLQRVARFTLEEQRDLLSGDAHARSA